MEKITVSQFEHDLILAIATIIFLGFDQSIAALYGMKGASDEKIEKTVNSLVKRNLLAISVEDGDRKLHLNFHPQLAEDPASHFPNRSEFLRHIEDSFLVVD